MRIQEIWNSFLAYLLSWVPRSFSEVFLFIITVAIVIIVVTLFHYTSIQRRVKKESRCYRDALLNRPGVGVYVLKGYASSGEEVFEIEYDIGAKKYTVNQKCTPGNVQNKVEIPVYDISTRTTQTMEKVFNCEVDFQLQNGASVVWGGYPELVRFAQYMNTDFFDRMLS